MVERLKRWARAVRREVLALWLAARDRRTPWAARGLAFVVAAYALSPIDLIPDVIPVLGLLDEAVLLPLLILLVMRLVGPERMAEHRAAASRLAGPPGGGLGAAIVLTLWIAALGLALWWLEPVVRSAIAAAGTR